MNTQKKRKAGAPNPAGARRLEADLIAEGGLRITIMIGPEVNKTLQREIAASAKQKHPKTQRELIENALIAYAKCP